MQSRGWILSTFALFAASGCTTGATSGTAPANVANIAMTARLQFGVGTATIATSNSTAIIGTNFTSTFRGPDGNNATGNNTPTITGPPAFQIGYPGSPNVLQGLSPGLFAQETTTAQTSGKGYPSSFSANVGPMVGVFGYGMAADNLISPQLLAESAALSTCADYISFVTGSVETTVPPVSGLGQSVTASYGNAARSSELPLPLGYVGESAPNAGCPEPVTFGTDAQASLFSANVGGHNGPSYPANFYGGPPAWPSPQGYGAPTFFLGFPLGFDDAVAAPVIGAYRLDVAYPTSTDYGRSGQLSASAQLRTTAPLPVIPTPSLVANGDGSVTVGVTIPPGLFETIVTLRSTDCDLTERKNPDDNYAQVLHASGPQVVVFAASLGPPTSSGTPTHTLCTSSDVPANFGVPGTASATVIGFDYPAYESSYPFDMTPTPKITNGDGHTGQADISISLPSRSVSNSGS